MASSDELRSLAKSGCRYGPFTDICDSQFKDAIVWLHDEGITAGCGPSTFCPEDSVTRGQLAAFLTRALDLPAGPDAFDDDDDSVFESAINALAAAGITRGCGTRRYCPDDVVRRDQLATFLTRTLDLPPGPEAFDDDDGNIHEKGINALAAAGITSGCGPRRFCPDNPVTREQLAAFLRRALTP